mmetsp:Transcript_8732/g.35648  ORF Transcript_8732/g.35648 Transcript_8732/m.35648 type:complete len:245 (-) Transcript_8732:1710-2444(-)
MSVSTFRVLKDGAMPIDLPSRVGKPAPPDEKAAATDDGAAPLAASAGDGRCNVGPPASGVVAVATPAANACSALPPPALLADEAPSPLVPAAPAPPPPPLPVPTPLPRTTLCMASKSSGLACWIPWICTMCEQYCGHSLSWSLNCSRATMPKRNILLGYGCRSDSSTYRSAIPSVVFATSCRATSIPKSTAVMRSSLVGYLLKNRTSSKRLCTMHAKTSASRLLPLALYRCNMFTTSSTLVSPL